ncbi:nuclease-related domain-containing protein [Hydrogenobacter hydrogenophilus]|uniref:Nuclease-related domain-containing protein n=1 Tax=Hydrogenobacter hydrogenophilus TaxID=35835 RepID=A0A285NYY4_9AQUI|nr:nuclease-related domain-containing protein [Hydrogenobacter hydrogenophilus]SNZ14694.1 Nuclease-related domain-containing protein [Hydrogenobacter hydrogenophilus]
MRLYLRWNELKLKLISISMGALSPLPLMMSFADLIPFMLGASLSTVMFLGSLSYRRRSENYRIGRKVEEQVEQILRACLPPSALLISDMKITYGNIDFLILGEDQILILEVKAGKLKGKRLENTYNQIQRQIQEMKEIYPDKRIRAFVINTTGKSFYYKDLKIISIKELCHEILGLLHTA